MPKQIYNNTDFSGGINGIDSPRDVVDTQVIKAKGVTFDEKGRIRMMGDSKIKVEMQNDSFDATAFESGTSLFYFAHDYNMLNPDGDINDNSTAIGGNWTFDYTGGAAEDLWTSGSNHNLAVGDTIRFLTRHSNPSEYDTNTTYYVKTVNSATTVTLSLTKGGSVVAGTADSGGNWTATDEVPTLMGAEFFALANREHVAIYDVLSGIWNLSAIDMGSDPGAGERILQCYFADAALRCYNPTFNTNVSSRWHGHIKRTLFEDSGEEVVKNKWYTTTTKLMAPEGNVAYDNTIGSENPGINSWANDGTANVSVTTQNHLTINMTSHADGGAGTWIAATYTFWLSYIYDGSQESPVGTGPGSGTAGDANSSYYNLGIGADQTLWIGVQYYRGASGPDHNERITGARLYYSDPADGDGIKYHLMDIDFSKGCKKFNETQYTEWNEDGGSGQDYQCPEGLIGANIFDVAGAFEFEDMPKTVTYDMLNGYSPNEITDAEFKCHTIFNNRAYIGNIKQDGKTYGDRIIRSPINFEGNSQYDTFPATHKMDVAANDGDDVTALEGFGDRLLIFKKQSVYVINIAQDGTEFVESKFSDLGVMGPSQVTATEYGVVWINDKGCYLYSGQGQPIDLITNTFSSFEGRVITPNMKWSVAEDKYPAVAFMPRHNKLLISLGLASGWSNDGYIYDFVKKSWSFGGGVIGAYQHSRSNFIVDNKGIIHFAGLLTNADSSTEMDIYRWEDVSQPHSEFNIWFKDIDFGQPNIRKKFYKAYLQFRASSTTNVTAHFITNGNYGQKLNFANGTGISSNVLTYSATYASLVPNGEFQTSSGRALESNTNASQLDSTSWYSNAENGGGTIMINQGVMTWANNVDSDFIPYAPITVTSGTTYEVSFTGITSSMDFTFGTTTPRIMCWITSANSATVGSVNHAGLLTNVKAFKVHSWANTYRFNFTADGSGENVQYIAFRAVVLDTGDDPDLFASYNPADANVIINQCQVSNVAVRQLDEWRRAELKPSTSSEANNIYSVGIRLDASSGTTVPADFEIDNISLVYRAKNIK